MTQTGVAEFFQALTAARVVIEAGTHSAWVQEIIAGCGDEVLVANPRLMEGSKGRKREAGTAVFDGDGELCARAKAIWIEPAA